MIFEVPIDHYPLNQATAPSLNLAARRQAPAITISRVDTTTTQLAPLSPSVRRSQFSFSGLRLPKMLDRQQSQSLPSLVQLQTSEQSSTTSTPSVQQPRRESLDLRKLSITIQLPQLRAISTPLLNRL